MNKKRLFIVFMLFILCICFCSCTEAAVQSDDDGKPTQKTVAGEALQNTPYVKWEGRYEYKNASSSLSGSDEVALYYTATGFTVEFYGTELLAEFYHRCTETGGSDIYYNVAVDDETLPTPAEGRTFCLEDAKLTQTITVVSDLSEGRHTVTCLKMDEASDAYTAIISLQTDGGFYERDSSADNQKMKFMFICASGGSGYGSLAYSEDADASQVRTRANSSSLHAFNYLTARMYDADVQFVASSGWGLLFTADKAISSILDYTGISGIQSNAYYNNVAGAATTAQWNWTCWEPDVIIFNIGGNDTKKSSFVSSEYKQCVVETVQRLHNIYPNAVMLWARTDGSKCGTYAMEALSDSGILSENYIKEAVIPQVGDDGTYGAAGHNSLRTHITTADLLATYLNSYFGLEPVRPNVSFEDFEHLLQTF